jgi:hypothetical protein
MNVRLRFQGPDVRWLCKLSFFIGTIALLVCVPHILRTRNLIVGLQIPSVQLEASWFSYNEEEKMD